MDDPEGRVLKSRNSLHYEIYGFNRDKFILMLFDAFSTLECIGKKEKKQRFSDPSLQNDWRIPRIDDPLGWLKQELNLLPHFLSEMRQALWWLDLSQKDLFRSAVAKL